MKNETTIKQAFEEYIDILCSQGNANSTVKEYSRVVGFLKTHLDYAKLMYVDQITHYQLNEFLNAQKEMKDLSDKTVYKYYAILRHLFENMYALGYTVENPMIRIHMKKPKKQIKHRHLSQTEIDQILETILKEPDMFRRVMDYSYILYLIETGSRRTDSTNLRWNQIKLSKETIQISVDKNHTSKEIPLSNRLKVALQELYKYSMPNPYDYVFLEIPEKRISENNITNRLRSYVLNSHIPLQGLVNDMIDVNPITPHTFKHAFITNKLIEGVDLIQLSNLTGNKDINNLRAYKAAIEQDKSALSTAINKNFKIPA